MEDQIKNIISPYINIPPDQIVGNTVIGRSAVASSIILHRMYAQLLAQGIEIKDYTSIQTFGQLMAGVNGKTPIEYAGTTPVAQHSVSNNPTELPVGIDIENISSMPIVGDFREAAFYTMNFSPAEIAYCILQSNPYASFTGLFAAKEAIVKADNSYKNRPFHSIHIDHLPEGKPIHAGFQLAVSHTSELAIAVAVKNIAFPSPLAATATSHTRIDFSSLIAWAAILLSTFTFALVFFKSC